MDKSSIPSIPTVVQPKRTGAFVRIDADEFEQWDCRDKKRSLGEIGQIVLGIRQALQSGDAASPLEYPFIKFASCGRTARAGRNAIPKAIRVKVLSVGLCLWCGSPQRLTVDHIKPYSRGGSDHLDNLQCLCLSCNCRKGTKESY